MKPLAQIQIGKNGISDNFIKTLKDNFKHHMNVKVAVLMGAGHYKEKVREYSEEILERLGKNYTTKIVGFTIIIKKWRKKVR